MFHQIEKRKEAVIMVQFPDISLRRTSHILHVSQMVWTLLERGEPKTTWVLLPAGTELGTPGALGCLSNVLAAHASCCCRDAKAQIRDKKAPEKGMHTKEDSNHRYFPFIPYLHFHLVTCACHQDNLQSVQIMFLSIVIYICLYCSLYRRLKDYFLVYETEYYEI